MKVRAVLLVLALLPTGAATSALAATKAKPVKPVCNVIKDASGDAGFDGQVPGDGDDDIVSGDVSSDGKTVTAVLRLAALSANDPQSPLGHNYIVTFGAHGAENSLFLAARTYATGTKFIFGYQTSDPTLPLNISRPIGDATGFVDLAKKEVHISAPNAAFAPAGSKLPKGSKLLGVGALSYRMVGQGLVPSMDVSGHWVPLGGVSEQFDDATGTSYVVGTPSCVKPGK
jgi:hypothetical protein